MTYELKENTGSLFKNNNKTQEKHPSYKGKINVAGKVLDIALWQRQTSKGDIYLSVMVSEPMTKQEQVITKAAAPVTTPPAETSQPLDDDIPF